MTGRRKTLAKAMTLEQALNLPANVTSLQLAKAVRQNLPDRDTVEVCEALLEKAKRGQLRGLIFGIVLNGEYRGGTTGHFRENPIEAIGMIAVMNQQVSGEFDWKAVPRKRP